MNWLLYHLDAHPYTVGLHAFPRLESQAKKFSKQRLDAAIKDSEFIREWYNEKESEQLMRKFTKAPDSKGLVPYNFYIIGATWESRKDTVGDAGRSMSLDFVVYDERQDHPNDVETVLGEGASHSAYKQTLTLGTPKLPGTQFDQEWESSDKNYWNITCPHCGTHQVITMDNIMDSGDDEMGYFYGCAHCKEPIDKGKGIWLPTNQQKHPQYHGYHISQLLVPWINANEIMKKFSSPTYPKRRFYNEVLGQAYGGDDVPITLAMMQACANNTYSYGEYDGGGLFVGVDWGNTSYMVIEDRNGGVGHKLVGIEMADETDNRQHPKHFAKALKRYNPHVRKVVCDAGPDISRYNNFADALVEAGVCPRGSVFPCYYTTPPAKTTINWNMKEHNVSVGRSEFIEAIIDEISDQQFIIPGEDKSMEKTEILMDHFTNIAAVQAKASSGTEFIIYENTGPDHFLHAKLYADVAASGGGDKPIGKSVASFANAKIEDLNDTALRKPQNKGSKFLTFGMSRRRH